MPPPFDLREEPVLNPALPPAEAEAGRRGLDWTVIIYLYTCCTVYLLNLDNDLCVCVVLVLCLCCVVLCCVALRCVALRCVV